MLKTLNYPRFPSQVLACWPMHWPEYENVWYMKELQLKRDGSLEWYLRRDTNYGPVVYRNLEEAIEEAKASNKILAGLIESIDLSSDQLISLKLKVEKAVVVEERLMTEECWMMEEAVRRHKDSSRLKVEELRLSIDFEVLREPLFNVLTAFPYVRYVRLAKPAVTLMLDGEGSWKKVSHTKKTALYCYREKIARAFDLDGTDHWGETKAAIRAALLPRANQLLHEMSFKMMLDDALRRGQRVVVCGGFVFWYEEDGGVGWVVKRLSESSTHSSPGKTIWEQGTIISTNHGRIVVLPYVKSNGEFVQGHTKNSSQDGPAIKRHPDHYVVLPFEVLKGDLMYDLFGRMKYE